AAAAAACRRRRRASGRVGVVDRPYRRVYRRARTSLRGLHRSGQATLGGGGRRPPGGGFLPPAGEIARERLVEAGGKTPPGCSRMRRAGWAVALTRDTRARRRRCRQGPGAREAHGGP